MGCVVPQVDKTLSNLLCIQGQLSFAQELRLRDLVFFPTQIILCLCEEPKWDVLLDLYLFPTTF